MTWNVPGSVLGYKQGTSCCLCGVLILVKLLNFSSRCHGFHRALNFYFFSLHFMISCLRNDLLRKRIEHNTFNSWVIRVYPDFPERRIALVVKPLFVDIVIWFYIVSHRKMNLVYRRCLHCYRFF